MSIYDGLVRECQRVNAAIAAERKRFWGGFVAIGFLALILLGTDAAQAMKAVVIVLAIIGWHFHRLLSEANQRLELAATLLLGIAEQSPALSHSEVAEAMLED